MSSPVQTNIIDFDLARSQRKSSAAGHFSLAAPINVTQLRQHLDQRLQSSLEAERILTLFFKHVQHLIPLDGLTYRHEESDVKLRLGDNGRHSVTYSLSYEGQSLGELGLQRNMGFLEQELADLESLLACLLFPIRNALLYRAATQSALRDPLTGTGNRIAMEQSLNQEIETAAKELRPLSVLMLDIDHFKQVNDTYGHCVGDEVLKSIANTLKAQLRNSDQVFRFGGEEFLIVLADTGRDTAAMLGERLRKAAQSLIHPAVGRPVELTISLGCATLLPAESADSLLRRVDGALYVAKRAGRNRLTMAG
ncbi:GGDEF domain-containing protein [Pseudomonas sp. Pseusp122]|uniref:GGDEF domain-containing protein n=1 Tax=unclassified Pseudomonas TaxID=196821 RepID=UPI0039A66E5E